MTIEVEVTVDAPKDDVWRLVSDIEGSASTVSGVDEIEVLERPAHGLEGLKWRETRTMFGKSATEVMWITDVVDGSYYKTEARNHGAIYRTHVYVEDDPRGVRLGMVFQAQQETLGAKVMWALTGFLMKRATRNALLQDLKDIKAAAEAGQTSHP